MPGPTVDDAIAALRDPAHVAVGFLAPAGTLCVAHAAVVAALTAGGADEATARDLVERAAAQLGGRLETHSVTEHGVHAGRSFPAVVRRTTVLIPAGAGAQAPGGGSSSTP
jgi:hypothetical protein